MKTLVILVLLPVFLAGTAAAADFTSVGVGKGVVLPRPDLSNPCPYSELQINADGSFENGCAWYYGGQAPPYYGAFAEGYPAHQYGVCGIQLLLTTLPNFYTGQTLDAYVWNVAGDNNPGNVLSLTAGVVISPPAIWPQISTHDIDVNDTYDGVACFVGFWGHWPGLNCGWFVAADCDGFGGIPRTNIAPGIGYPTGWQDPSLIWGPIAALGIGAYRGGQGIIPDDPPPTSVPDPQDVRVTTWGQIKETF